MSDARIDGAIQPEAYLHVKYNNQWVNGRLYTLWDIVIVPDDRGNVSFTLPQGIQARIEFWSEHNGHIDKVLDITIPERERILLAELEALSTKP